MQIGKRHRFLLRDAVESVLALFEGERAKNHSIDAHFVGAMYMQAVMAYLFASPNATSTTALCSLVRRVAQAIFFGWFRPPPASCICHPELTDCRPDAECIHHVSRNVTHESAGHLSLVCSLRRLIQEAVWASSKKRCHPRRERRCALVCTKAT